MPDERVARSVERTVTLLRGLIEELDLSEGEWMRALAFLTEVGHADEFILLSDVLGISVFVDQRSHRSDATSTSSNVLGPFYLPDAPLLDLPYRIAADDEPGEPLFFHGRVTDAGTGEPLPGAMLDVWQADDSARYDVQTPGMEPHLRGRFLAGASGDFELRTIVPPPYEIPKDGPVGRLLKELGRHAWRPAHLHLKVSHPGHESLTTMIYFEGDPWLDSDTIGSVKASLIASLERHGADDTCARPYARCAFDVALPPAAGAPVTPR